MSQITITPEVIDHMVNRFLMWKLPETFSPDNGISFKPTFNDSPAAMRSLGLTEPMKCNPIGTNLFCYNEATEMVKYMLEGLNVPEPDETSKEGVGGIDSDTLFGWEASAFSSERIKQIEKVARDLATCDGLDPDKIDSGGYPEWVRYGRFANQLLAGFGAVEKIRESESQPTVSEDLTVGSYKKVYDKLKERLIDDKKYGSSSVAWTAGIYLDLIKKIEAADE